MQEVDFCLYSTSLLLVLNPHLFPSSLDLVTVLLHDYLFELGERSSIVFIRLHKSRLELVLENAAIITLEVLRAIRNIDERILLQIRLVP